MKYFLLALVIFLTSCVTASKGFSEDEAKGKINNIFNGSFEDGNYDVDNLPDGWIVLDETVMESIKWDNTLSFEGDKSLQFSNAKRRIEVYSENFEIRPKSIYYIKLKAKASTKKSKQIYLHFFTFDKFNKLTGKHKIAINPTNEWKTFHQSFSFFKAKTRFGRVVLQIPSDVKNIISIDDIGCYEMHSFQNHKI